MKRKGRKPGGGGGVGWLFEGTHAGTMLACWKPWGVATLLGHRCLSHSVAPGGTGTGQSHVTGMPGRDLSLCDSGAGRDQLEGTGPQKPSSLWGCRGRQGAH